jgi:hypothetical protein
MKDEKLPYSLSLIPICGEQKNLQKRCEIMFVDIASLFIGIFVGGLVMWGVDWFLYGQVNDKGYARLQKLEEENEEAHTRLNELEIKLDNSENLRKTADQDLVLARADAKEAQLKLEKTEKMLSDCQAKLRTPLP